MTASNFREVSHVRVPNAAENLAERIIRGTQQTHMKKGTECGGRCLKGLCNSEKPKLKEMWTGDSVSPDGLVYDPLKKPSFCLVEIKCANALSYIDTFIETLLC